VDRGVMLSFVVQWVCLHSQSHRQSSERAIEDAPCTPPLGQSAPSSKPGVFVSPNNNQSVEQE
jgi:hypothetical protein